MAAKAIGSFEPLANFTFNSMSPFGTFAEDLATDALKQAHALTLALNTVVTQSVDAGDADMPLRSVHMAQALDGIMTLMGLAAYAREAAKSER